MRLREKLLSGLVIPAHPLALSSNRKLDERHQRALTRYYVAAGAGGIAVGVHTTQFAIRNFGLYQPVLEIAAEEITSRIKVAGVLSIAEAQVAANLGYDAALLSLAPMQQASVDDLIAHCQAVATMIPVFGFYLQPSVGGRLLPYTFWRRFAEIENVVAIKIAPFNRYQTLDVIRAVHDSGRAAEIALYTGNDDMIILDLLSGLGIVGGLLGHWAVWTKTTVETFNYVRAIAQSGCPIPPDLMTLNSQTTDANSALFDAANGFRGCIAGIHEILRRQGLLAGRWCLDPHEDLSPGQPDEIDRVCRAYPHLQDDAFVQEHLDEWLK
jgi:dihydrodipicolinate synthase/N-acetylneuraminate lyase